MKDSDFKKLSHQVGTLQVGSIGNEVADGYKPDLTIKDEDGRLLFIVECEQKTDRKAFIGALVKAEKFAEECHAQPVLIIVMQTFDNTTVHQIAKHLAPYTNWLSRLKGGALNLREVLVIADTEYRASVGAAEVLGSKEFRARTNVVYSQT